MIHPSLEKVSYVLDGTPLTKEDALLIKDLKGEDILDLISLSN